MEVYLRLFHEKDVRAFELNIEHQSEGLSDSRPVYFDEKVVNIHLGVG